MRQLIFLAALGLMACSGTITVGQALPPESHVSPLTGTWKTAIADSLVAGTFYMTLEVHGDGSVSGTLESGTVAGRLDGKTFTYTITEKFEGNLGSYSGRMVLKNNRWSGTYTGHDGSGDHENGVISMERATEEEIASIVARPVFAKPEWAADPDPAPTRIRLIIRGDDFGNTHASNLAMEQAFASGVMTSASVMPAGPWFAETAALIRAHPEWVIGLHLSITSAEDRLRFGPTSSPDEVPSLVASDGFFYHSFPGMPLNLESLREPPYLYGGDEEIPPSILTRRRRLTSSVAPAPAEVEKEFRSQIRRAQQLGVRIDYIDCHMGILPELRPVMIRLAEELSVPIPELGWMAEANLYYEGNADTATRYLADRLRTLQPGLHRLVLHPVVDTMEARAADSYLGPKGAYGGQAELHALASDEIQAVIKEMSIELVSVRDLWNYEKGRLKSFGVPR